jgi:hypothetical protein
LDKVYYDTTMERLNEGIGEFFEWLKFIIKIV